MLDRPGLRGGPADDVHRRLRDRRRRPGARPPVRGDVLLPGGRGRGRAGRRATHDPGRATSCSPASAASTGSTTPAPSASAGSRRRRPSRRPATPTAGSPTLEAVRGGAAMRMSTVRVVVVGGTRAIGLEIVKHYAAAGPGGRPHRPDAGERRGRGRRVRSAGTSGASTFDLAEPARRSPPPWPTSGRSSGSPSSPSTATRTRSPTTTSTGRSGW